MLQPLSGYTCRIYCCSGKQPLQFQCQIAVDIRSLRSNGHSSVHQEPSTMQILPSYRKLTTRSFRGKVRLRRVSRFYSDPYSILSPPLSLSLSIFSLHHRNSICRRWRDWKLYSRDECKIAGDKFPSRSKTIHCSVLLSLAESLEVRARDHRANT